MINELRPITKTELKTIIIAFYNDYIMNHLTTTDFAIANNLTLAQAHEFLSLARRVDNYEAPIN